MYNRVGIQLPCGRELDVVYSLLLESMQVSANALHSGSSVVWVGK